MRHKDGLVTGQRTPIGELHFSLIEKGIKDELYQQYRTHLKLILKHIGAQPAHIQIENGPSGQTVILRWWNDFASFSVQIEELPF